MTQSRVPVRTPLGRWVGATPVLLRIALTLAALALTVAACDGRGGGGASSSDDGLAEYMQATRGGLIKLDQANGMAFGQIWRQETHDKRDLQRGVDAYKWAIRTCQAVIDGQTPEAMVRQVRDSGFTEPGARVVVTAALRALCPEWQTVWFTRPALGLRQGAILSQGSAAAARVGRERDRVLAAEAGGA